MRNFIRHPSDIPIEIRYLGQALPQERQLNNISVGGLSLQTDMYLDKDTIVYVKIPVVKLAFETKARVVWCEKRGDHFDVGAEFTEEKEGRILTAEKPPRNGLPSLPKISPIFPLIIGIVDETSYYYHYRWSQ